jgi:hypothetical protein
VLAVLPGGASIASISGYCSSLRVVATIHSPYGMPNIENDGQVYLCTGLREPLGQLWPKFRHYD